MLSRERQGPIVAIVYVAAMFMAILDTTIVNVALPTIGRDFQARPDSVGLISIAYLISLAVFIPASGWLGDRFGGRRVLLSAIALFTGASALCGLAGNLSELVLFRVLQGAGGAVMTPVGLAMLFRIYPPAERVRLSSILALFTTLGPALGPILGGVFTTTATWRLVFFVNVPVGLGALALGASCLAAHRTEAPGRLDAPGLILSALGFGSLMFGVSEGPTRGWSNGVVLATVAIGVILLVTLVVVETSRAAPLIDFRLLGDRMFRASTCLYCFGSVSYLGALYLVALLLQDGFGLSPLQAGLSTFPAAIGTMIGAQLVTRVLYPRLGPRRLTGAGLALVTATLVLLGRIDAHTSLWLVRSIMCGLGLGISCVFIPAQAASMATIAKGQIGRASAIFNAGKQIGGAVGVALLTTVLAIGPAHHAAVGSTPDVSSFHDAFLAAAVVAALTMAVALSIRDDDAGSTRTSRLRTRPSRPAAAPTPAPLPGLRA